MNEAEIQAALNTECVFCERILTGQFDVESNTFDAVAFKPNNPVTEGHILVVPREHASNAMVDPRDAAKAMIFALTIARSREEQCNLITSCGPDATQTIMHTHIHLVPRRPDDGLKLPWTDQVVDRLKCLNVNPDDNTVWCVRDDAHTKAHQGFAVDGSKVFWPNSISMR